MVYSSLKSHLSSMQYEFNLTVKNMGTQDYSEGIASFREKKSPLLKENNDLQMS